ncbi:phosphotransferase enzyme family protein [Nocardia africana]|uniref:Homoserine kinase n=1 Tax=Nocardia africana TaxID=134964 RepID=A0A378X340_9NOCA|nr:phosphotransferase [Nocardia africana]MCC3317141.1 phosphotransferase [Nocardia africana]SUA47869.1 homoserine kinase [Nocardia africana]
MGESGLAAPAFSPLTPGELGDLFAESGAPPVIEWRSRRPLSSTARVRLGDGTRVVVKRMPSALRDPATLAPEHAFMNHLRAQGISIPRVRTAEHGEFTYEIQELGAGEDRYRDDFSWSPYHSVADAAAAGAMLARLHLAAVGFDAPERPPHPLLAGLCTDPAAAVDRYVAARPEVGRFLAAERDQDAARSTAGPPPGRPRATDGPASRSELAAAVATLPPLWTHNDWHGTNLLWSDGRIATVLDFGLANRTVAVFDLATAIERFAIDWLSIAADGPAHVQTGQLAAFLRGYGEIRPLHPMEREVLPDLFPLVHIVYELSEIDYFLTIPPRRQVRNARIAYRNYFLGRSVWAASAEGKAFTTMLRRLSAECC